MNLREDEMEIEVGKVYDVHHQRKGKFRAQVIEADGEWVTLKIVAGVAEGMREDWEPGEVMGARKSLCSFAPV